MTKDVYIIVPTVNEDEYYIRPTLYYR